MFKFAFWRKHHVLGESQIPLRRLRESLAEYPPSCIISCFIFSVFWYPSASSHFPTLRRPLDLLFLPTFSFESSEVSGSDMSTLRALTQRLPGLRSLPKQLPSSLAQQARCYGRLSTSPIQSRPVRVAQFSPMSRPFSTSLATSHGHVDPPKPGEE